MQSPNLKEEEMGQLQAIDNTTKKLASLNKALLLLAKIENNQFKENSIVSIKDTTIKVIGHFEDLITAKNISIENKITTDLEVNINPTLADILITNLIQNAIRHNINGGKIIAEIQDNSLVISNTGEPLKINSNELFTRFKKNDASKESLGLGLSIVKSITELYNYSITYIYKNSRHTFTLNFN
jgi:signal transduction histidine kinase